MVNEIDPAEAMAERLEVLEQFVLDETPDDVALRIYLAERESARLTEALAASDAKVARARAIHHPDPVLLATEGQTICHECDLIEWPCPTLATLGDQ